MANRKEKIERGTFGAAPVLGVLPSVKSLGDDVAMFTAIGAIGGNLQFMVCSTMFYFGSLAKAKKEKYNGGKAWEAYYAKSGLNYANKDVRKTSSPTRSSTDFAQVKTWDTQRWLGECSSIRTVRSARRRPPSARSWRTTRTRPVGGGLREAPPKSRRRATRPDHDRRGQRARRRRSPTFARTTTVGQIEATHCSPVRGFEKVDLFSAMAATITDKARANASGGCWWQAARPRRFRRMLKAASPRTSTNSYRYQCAPARGRIAMSGPW